MRTERVTVLMTLGEKAALSARAAMLGVSSGAVLRAGLDEEEQITAEEEVELTVLVEQVNEALPKMRASIDSMIERMDAAHQKVDAFLKDAGVRK